MERKRVFIDGGAGTTGLRIYDRLSEMDCVEVLSLPEDKRKNPDERRRAIHESDAVFLCLPDSAAIESVSLAEGSDTIIIDASTAHRTSKGWAYGFPELSCDFEEKIKSSGRIAVPGCHASGFVSLVYPLISNGILRESARLTCHSLTGYSGGGKKMIAEYEGEGRDILLDAPRQYALTQAHKHLPEMKIICGLENFPVFCPIVADYYSGMTVTVPVFAEDLANGYTVSDIVECYSSLYCGPVVKYSETVGDEGGMLSGAVLSGSDSMKIHVCGNEERILLISSFDNLGKGASGAAVECMNIAFGFDRTNGLNLI